MSALGPTRLTAAPTGAPALPRFASGGRSTALPATRYRVGSLQPSPFENLQLFRSAANDGEAPAAVIGVGPATRRSHDVRFPTSDASFFAAALPRRSVYKPADRCSCQHSPWLEETPCAARLTLIFRSLRFAINIGLPTSLSIELDPWEGEPR